jgi:cyclase
LLGAAADGLHHAAAVCQPHAGAFVFVGGAGGAAHFVEVFEGTDIHAAAAANFFHYTEHSVTVAKAALLRAGVFVRNDARANYLENPLDKNGRLEKKIDQALEEMLFVRIEKEVI